METNDHFSLTTPLTQTYSSFELPKYHIYGVLTMATFHIVIQESFCIRFAWNHCHVGHSLVIDFYFQQSPASRPNCVQELSISVEMRSFVFFHTNQVCPGELHEGFNFAIVICVICKF